jgi:hypothetical protein
VFPAATNLDARWCSENAGRLAWRGQPITILPPLEIRLTSGSNPISVHPKFEIFPPTAIALYPHNNFGIAAVFGEWHKPSDSPTPGVGCDFPPAWSKLAAVHFRSPGTRNGSQYLWNRANPVVQAVDPDIWEQVLARHPSLTPQAVLEFEGLTRRQRDAQAPVFLLRSILDSQTPPAKLLARCPPEWLPLCVWEEDPSQPRLKVENAQSKGYYHYARDDISQYLPDPGDEWRLSVSPELSAKSTSA